MMGYAGGVDWGGSSRWIDGYGAFEQGRGAVRVAGSGAHQVQRIRSYFSIQLVIHATCIH